MTRRPSRDPLTRSHGHGLLQVSVENDRDRGPCLVAARLSARATPTVTRSGAVISTVRIASPSRSGVSPARSSSFARRSSKSAVSPTISGSFAPTLDDDPVAAADHPGRDALLVDPLTHDVHRHRMRDLIDGWLDRDEQPRAFPGPASITPRTTPNPTSVRAVASTGSATILRTTHARSYSSKCARYRDAIAENLSASLTNQMARLYPWEP